MSKINFVGYCLSTDDELAEHKRSSRSRWLAKVGDLPCSDNLAVVGGGPITPDHLQEIREFQGDIWAINGAWRWLKDEGIDATFYAIDPHIGIAGLAFGAEDAILADTVHPAVFDALHSIEVEIAWTGLGYITTDSTAASTSPMIAFARGHKHITYYGCDSSFTGRTHSYDNKPMSFVWVNCGGAEYKTSPQLIMQAEFLSAVIRGTGDLIEVRGNGFLSALIKNGDYAVTYVSKTIDDALNGSQIDGSEKKSQEAKREIQSRRSINPGERSIRSAEAASV